MPDGACRQLHANELRPFVARVQHVGIINDQDAEFGAVEYSPVPVNTQTVSLSSCRVDMNTLQHLDSVQCQQLLALLGEFAEVFADSPGLCTAVEHEINITSDVRPRMTRAYRVPEILKQEIEKQVDDLLKARFIVPPRSPMGSGVVCVLKPDNSIRMACDYRYLNSYTVGDAFPMPNLSNVMYRVGRGRVIST